MACQPAHFCANRLRSLYGGFGAEGAQGINKLPGLSPLLRPSVISQFQHDALNRSGWSQVRDEQFGGLPPNGINGVHGRVECCGVGRVYLATCLGPPQVMLSTSLLTRGPAGDQGRQSRRRTTDRGAYECRHPLVHRGSLPVGRCWQMNDSRVHERTDH